MIELDSCEVQTYEDINLPKKNLEEAKKRIAIMEKDFEVYKKINKYTRLVRKNLKTL